MPRSWVGRGGEHIVATPEEAEANKELAALENLDVHSAEFDAKLAEFQRAVEHHARAPTHPHPTAAGSTVAQWTMGPFASLLDRAKDAIRS